MFNRLRCIEFPDSNSSIVDLDKEKLSVEIERLGGKGDVIVLLDADNLYHSLKNDLKVVNKIFDRINIYSKKIHAESARMTKIACMNSATHREIFNTDFMACIQKSGFQSKTSTLFRLTNASIVEVDVQNLKESADLKIMQKCFQFLIDLKDSSLNAHIFIISQDSDFHILTNELKKYTKVKTHLMTSIIQRSFVNGLVDVVVYYKSAFESRNQKRTLSSANNVDKKSSKNNANANDDKKAKKLKLSTSSSGDNTTQKKALFTKSYLEKNKKNQ